MTDLTHARPVRRIISVNGLNDLSYALADAPVDDVLRDPARSGFSCARVWATDITPARPRSAAWVASLPRSLEPPRNGMVFHVYTLPPDAGWSGTITEAAVRAYFAAAGSPQACRFAPDAPHPYMQQTHTLDLCVVIAGEVTLVLDHEAVTLGARDTVVQRGTRHAWSNRSDKPCMVAVSSHDARRD